MLGSFFNPFNYIIDHPIRDLIELYKCNILTFSDLIDLFEYYKLDSFFALVEHHYGEILSFGDKIISGENLNTYYIRLLLSNVLAMYFTDLYRNDKITFMKEISCFFELFGFASEEELLSHFNLGKIIEGSKHVMNEYIRSYRK